MYGYKRDAELSYSVLREMPFMPRTSLLKNFLVLAGSAFVLAGAADKARGFEGILTVTETRDGISTQTVYTGKGEKLRIENADKSKPEPINVVDLAAKKLTIVYPHNSSFVVLDLIKNDAPSSSSNRAPGVIAPPDSTEGGVSHGLAFTPPPRPGLATSPPPGFPTPPPAPSMPAMPNLAGAGPMMPPIPALGGTGAATELKKTEKTKKIQGFNCVCYTLSDGTEIFEIWAAPDADLFPFRLLQTSFQNRQFGPRMLEEQWVELLQKQSLFPLEASMRTILHHPVESRAGATAPADPDRAPAQSQERFSFKVEMIERKKIDNTETLFSPPKNFNEILGQQP